MGEYADMAIAEGMAREEWDDVHPEDSDEGCPIAFIGFPPQEITCRRCGKADLSWGHHTGSWRLYEKGELHKCDFSQFQYDFIAHKWIKTK